MLISLQPAIKCKTIFQMRTPIQYAFLAENKPQMHRRFFSWLFVFSVVVLLGCLPLFGQTSSTGAIAGTIADPSGAVVGDAQVATINTANGVRRSTLSDKQGVYRISLLEPGIYDIEVATQNFKGERKTGIVVSVGETYVVNFTLQVGSRDEEVTVHGGTQLVQSESATVGGLVGRQMIESLPLSTRNYTQILDLSTGVLGDRIVGVGSNRDIDEWRGPKTRLVDAGGKLLLPGFNDAHAHLVLGGEQLDAVQLKDAGSAEVFAHRIEDLTSMAANGSLPTSLQALPSVTAQDQDTEYFSNSGSQSGGLPMDLGT